MTFVNVEFLSKQMGFSHGSLDVLRSWEEEKRENYPVSREFTFDRGSLLKMKSLRHVTHFPYISSGLSEDDACTEADN